MYSLTRTNVYAGLASEYLITDEDPEGEMGLLMSGVVPGMKPPVTLGASYPIGIPLVIQDKTFWDGQMGPGAQDPNYGKVPPAGAAEGSLWYPHVYEGGIDPDDLPSMALTDLPGTSTLRWGATPIGNATGVDPGQFPLIPRFRSFSPTSTSSTARHTPLLPCRRGDSASAS